jgi:class I fructose-bisphosphate aldolase
VDASRRGLRVFDRDLGLGKRTRLRRLFPSGAPLLLRLDQGLELGPGADAPEAADPGAVLRLAVDAGCSGAIAQIGMAEQYFKATAGQLPLVLKLNGRTSIPPDDEALAPLNATVEDALRLGADAVAYTLYAGSPAQFEDFTQLSHVRQECTRYGMPLVVLAEPRGAAVERKGGTEGSYALEYAVRAAAELGADLIVARAPVVNAQRDAQAPKPYSTFHFSGEEAQRRVIAASGITPIVSAQDGDGMPEAVVAQASAALDAGAQGLVYGRPLWQRPAAELSDLTARLRALL